MCAVHANCGASRVQRPSPVPVIIRTIGRPAARTCTPGTSTNRPPSRFRFVPLALCMSVRIHIYRRAPGARNFMSDISIISLRVCSSGLSIRCRSGTLMISLYEDL